MASTGNSQPRGRYRIEQFQSLMADNGVVGSMGRSGNVGNEAAINSFFSALKTERVGKKVQCRRDDDRADAFDYVGRFDSAVRRRPTIGYPSRVEFERKVGLP